MCINDEKTEYTIIIRLEKEHQQGNVMNVEGYLFKKVTYFMYLGHLPTQDNDLKMEINTTLQKGDICYFGRENILNSRN